MFMAYFKTYRPCFHKCTCVCMWVCTCILHACLCAHVCMRLYRQRGLAGHTAVSATVISGCRDKCHLSFLPFAWDGAWDGAEMWAPGKPQTSPEHRSIFRSNLCSRVQREFTSAHSECFPCWQMDWEPPTPLLGVHTLPPAPLRESAPSQEPTHPRSH